jgi:hypothetical protein
MKLYPLLKTSAFCAFPIVISAVLFPLIARFCEKKTDGFSIARITSYLQDDPKWETHISSPQEQGQWKSILNQRFHYLGSGGQCFAFLSEDGQYVLKLLRHHFYVPPAKLSKLPLPERIKNALMKRSNYCTQKLYRDFTSYKIAFEELPEECALCFVHLNKTHVYDKKVTIIDKLGIEHHIDINTKEFILQQKAELFYPYIKNLLQKHDLDGVKNAISKVLNLLTSRCQKGIFDEDPRVHKNLGFIGERPIFIDIGRFRKDEKRVLPDVYINDIVASTTKFRDWIAIEYPTLIPIFDELIEKLQYKDIRSP